MAKRALSGWVHQMKFMQRARARAKDAKGEAAEDGEAGAPDPGMGGRVSAARPAQGAALFGAAVGGGASEAAATREGAESGAAAGGATPGQTNEERWVAAAPAGRLDAPPRCTVIMEADPPPPALVGRMSFGSFGNLKPQKPERGTDGTEASGGAGGAAASSATMKERPFKGNTRDAFVGPAAASKRARRVAAAAASGSPPAGLSLHGTEGLRHPKREKKGQGMSPATPVKEEEEEEEEGDAGSGPPPHGRGGPQGEGLSVSFKVPSGDGGGGRPPRPGGGGEQAVGGQPGASGGVPDWRLQRPGHISRAKS